MGKDPQFFYALMILPFLFGLTLLGDGLYKLSKEEWGGGLLSITLGVIFCGVVIFAYALFTNYLYTGRV